jgi:hypothetical protein
MYLHSGVPLGTSQQSLWIEQSLTRLLEQPALRQVGPISNHGDSS